MLFLSSADFFFKIYIFKPILSGIPSECQTVWIQIRPYLGSDFLDMLSADDKSHS